MVVYLGPGLLLDTTLTRRLLVRVTLEADKGCVGMCNGIKGESSKRVCSQSVTPRKQDYLGDI